MKNLRFYDLPMVVRVTSATTMILAWITFEEIVIDRYHLDRFLPFYRVGNYCVYDLAAGLLVALFWVLAHRRRDTESTQA
jgi:hypothetical protein